MNLFKKKEKFIYFLHIPKTAGTSFIALIDNYFDHDKIFPEQIWHKILNQSTNQKNFDLIRGHFGYSIKAITTKKPIYITMLRNPIERTISFFDHMRLEPKRNNWVSEEFVNNIKNFQDIIQDNQKRKVFSNNQTRYLGQDLEIEKLLKQDDFEKFRLEEYQEFIEYDKSKKKCLNDAKKRLSDFIFFGVLERFEESIQLLFYTFAWKPNDNIRKLMIAPKKHYVTEDIKKEIEKMNDLDIQLYEYAQNIFDKKYNEMIEDLKNRYPNNTKNEKISIYKLLNKHYEDNYYNEKQVSGKIDYNFSQKLFGSGWYYREATSENNKFFRWTGPGIESEIDLVLPKKDHLKIEFRVIGYGSIEILNSIQLIINDEKIELNKEETLEKNPIFVGLYPIIFKGKIQNIVIEKQKIFSKLIFCVNNIQETETFSYTYTKKKRNLGIAIDRIKIE